jgi:glycosyltransferase involved in cell wall biosynthesis
MRIAQVAPLIESVPPKHYGGTERIVSYLTEELVRAGHDVTLFASGDSVTNARLIASCERSLRKNERCKDPVAREVLLVDHVIEHVNEFDLIHFHTGYLHFPICRYLPVPHLTTLHGRLDMPDVGPVSPYRRLLQLFLRSRHICAGSRPHFWSPSEFIQQRIIFSFHCVGNDLTQHRGKFESVSAVTRSND